jgi:hypothetical protein
MKNLHPLLGAGVWFVTKL